MTWNPDGSQCRALLRRARESCGLMWETPIWKGRCRRSQPSARIWFTESNSDSIWV